MSDRLHVTCIDVTTLDAAPGSAWVCGPHCPAVVPPDPDRDARVAARRAVERQRASAALDRFIEDLYGEIMHGH